MATITISITGSTIGTLSRTLTLDEELSDALLAELLSRYGLDENSEPRAPDEACTAALDGYLTGLHDIAKRRIIDDAKKAAAEAAAIAADDTPPVIE